MSEHSNRKFNIHCVLVGREGPVREGLTYQELCDLLEANRHKLFGYYVFSGNEFWSCSNFLRYQTQIPM